MSLVELVSAFCFRLNYSVQHDTEPPPRNGQDGVDRALGGGVCSHSAVPHHAADRDGLLEVRKSSVSLHNHITEASSRC